MSPEQLSYQIGDLYFEAFIDLSESQSLEILTWRNHPQIRQWMYHSDLISPDEHLRFIQGLKNNSRHAYWLVSESGQAKGVAYLNAIDQQHAHAEFGMYVSPQSFGQGYGKKIGKALLELAFAKLNLNCLRLEVMSTNQAARGLYTALGFETCGQIRNWVQKESGQEDILIMVAYSKQT